MNTHEKYMTVEHHHFDFLDMENNYPESALMIVGCSDGRWFIQQEFGEEYSQFPGVVKSGSDLDTEPTFYNDVDSAAKAAFSYILQVYPSTPKNLLDEFVNS
ncbi:hypothetical protein BZ763_23380 [Salmonella enterica subsp. enterica serovar Enteritidis]|nr:hypothetical protein [Salmonella enterica subsp. enterica serovar Enteritidis]